MIEPELGFDVLIGHETPPNADEAIVFNVCPRSVVVEGRPVLSGASSRGGSGETVTSDNYNIRFDLY